MIKKNLLLFFLGIAFSLNAQQVRHIETINDAWDFYKGKIENPFSNDGSRSWEKVTIPHSWNTQDILDDEDGYYRGEGWYKKSLVIPQVYENQNVFLFFEGANQVTSLFVNGNFNKLDLLNAQLDKNQLLLDGMNTNYNGGSLKWILDPALDELLNIDDVFILENDIKVRALKSNSDQRQSTSKPSNTALKVLGLLMHDLAKKNKKYASGTSPNKSQIKELLIDLAVELDINQYGLSKVDERLLTDALNYLDSQKN